MAKKVSRNSVKSPRRDKPETKTAEKAGPAKKAPAVKAVAVKAPAVKAVAVKAPAVKAVAVKGKKPAGPGRPVPGGRNKPAAAAGREPLPAFAPAKRNIRCRRCSLADGYDSGEKTCHFCGVEIFEIDIL